MFTKQHFISTAKTVKSLPVKNRKSVATKFASQFSKDNPRFDKQKFYDACGIK